MRKGLNEIQQEACVTWKLHVMLSKLVVRWSTLVRCAMYFGALIKMNSAHKLHSAKIVGKNEVISENTNYSDLYVWG